jgi:hypothetical protein
MSVSPFVSVVSMFRGLMAMIYMTATLRSMSGVVVRPIVWRPRDNEVTKGLSPRITVDNNDSGLMPPSSS